MAARRLIFILLVLLMISSFAAALVPIERESSDETSSSTTSTTTKTGPDTSGGRLLERTIKDARKPQTVRIELGDQLQLSVASNSLDEVEIPALGELEAVEPGSPAFFDLLPFEVGEYPVRLVEGDREIGMIEVVKSLGQAGRGDLNGAGKQGSGGHRSDGTGAKAETSSS